jgi:site-specific recombinase XerD
MNVRAAAKKSGKSGGLRIGFLRMRAPDGPLKPASVHDVLDHRRRLSGLDIPEFGTHVLRHSLAAHLLRQGVGIKTIGDTLGHRDIDSTFIWALRTCAAWLCPRPLRSRTAVFRS